MTFNADFLKESNKYNYFLKTPKIKLSQNSLLIVKKFFPNMIVYKIRVPHVLNKKDVKNDH